MHFKEEKKNSLKRESKEVWKSGENGMVNVV